MSRDKLYFLLLGYVKLLCARFPRYGIDHSKNSRVNCGFYGGKSYPLTSALEVIFG
jgi:hypothetical protein